MTIMSCEFESHSLHKRTLKFLRFFPVLEGNGRTSREQIKVYFYMPRRRRPSPQIKISREIFIKISLNLHSSSVMPIYTGRKAVHV